MWKLFMAHFPFYGTLKGVHVYHLPIYTTINLLIME